jgi:dTDP-4-amino-4,6-dideoxygalactose transaminase
MMLYQQPPVGNPIRLSENIRHGKALFYPYKAQYYNSGTVSLAAAIKTAIKITKLDEPEIIVPAYGCPDILSAVIYAGAKPVFVDFEENRPWMNISQVEQKITRSTAAIICVNFLGIAERITTIKKITNDRKIFIIEDSAQAMPACIDGRSWNGDFVVISFGRGKPVNLLGGGAMLYKENSIKSYQDSFIAIHKTSWYKSAAYRLKAKLYNKIINPRFYIYLQYIPFLDIGKTKYKPIRSMDGFDEYRLSILNDNIEAYCNKSVERQLKVHEIINSYVRKKYNLIDLTIECLHDLNIPLLRYPLLIDSSSRDELYSELCKQGLGASRLYPTVLPNYLKDDMKHISQDDYPCAYDFSCRILTLPTHQGITETDIDNIKKVFSSFYINKAP